MATMRPRPLGYPAQWRIFLERQVSAYLIVVGGIRSGGLAQMPGSDDSHVIQTLAAYCADHTLEHTYRAVYETAL
jgi:hypothetical protein